MARSKTRFKTNVDQPIVSGKRRRVQRNESYLAGKPEPINAGELDPSVERVSRLKWILKWVIGLPLAVYLALWFMLSMFDLFLS